MKTKWWAYLLSCIVVSGISTAADAELHRGQVLFGPLVGGGVPIGDFGDVADPGFSFGGTADYLFSSNLAIGADVIYNMMDASSALTSEVAPDVDFDWSVLQFGGHAKLCFNPQARANPFLVGGAGLYREELSSSPRDPNKTSTETNLGVYGGVGGIIRATQSVTVSISGVIHTIFADGDSSLTGEDTSQYFGIMLAALFSAGGV